MHKNALRSGRKNRLIMVSGLFLVCFLTVHLCINLTALWGERVYNDTFHYVGSQPLAQHLISLFGLGLMAHILIAFYVSAKSYYSIRIEGKRAVRGFLSMLTLGIIILGFGGIHIVNFWHKTRLRHLLGQAIEDSPYLLVSDLFRQPLYVVVYLVWIGALWYHLSCGGWNILATLSSRKEVAAGEYRLLKWVSTVFATLIAIGFAIIPLWFAFGLDK